MFVPLFISKLWIYKVSRSCFIPLSCSETLHTLWDILVCEQMCCIFIVDVDVTTAEKVF